MRGGEGLVQIDVHDVYAEIAGPRDAYQCIHVGAIHVEHGALGVQDLGRFGDVLFEHADRVGIGDHEGGDVLVDGAREDFEIDFALLVGTDIFDCVSGDGGCSWIRAVRGIGDENLFARVAALFHKSMDQEDSC